jgi:hypothetical protein
LTSPILPLKLSSLPKITSLSSKLTWLTLPSLKIVNFRIFFFSSALHARQLLSCDLCGIKSQSKPSNLAPNLPHPSIDQSHFDLQQSLFCDGDIDIGCDGVAEVGQSPGFRRLTATNRQLLAQILRRISKCKRKTCESS